MKQLRKFRFCGKMKHCMKGSKLYKDYEKSIEFLCEVEGAQFQNAFTHGKTYAVIEYYPPEYDFKMGWLNRLLNRRAWKGVYLQELKEV